MFGVSLEMESTRLRRFARNANSIQLIGLHGCFKSTYDSRINSQNATPIHTSTEGKVSSDAEIQFSYFRIGILWIDSVGVMNQIPKHELTEIVRSLCPTPLSSLL